MIVHSAAVTAVTPIAATIPSAGPSKAPLAATLATPTTAADAPRRGSMTRNATA